MGGAAAPRSVMGFLGTGGKELLEGQHSRIPMMWGLGKGWKRNLLASHIFTPTFWILLVCFFVAGPDFTQASRLLRTAPDLLLGGFRLSARLRSCPLSCPGGWDVFGKHQLG